jgi:hypothetical protein
MEPEALRRADARLAEVCNGPESYELIRAATSATAPQAWEWDGRPSWACALIR